MSSGEGMGERSRLSIPWREDLLANTGKSGIAAAFVAMLTSPGFAVITTWRIAKMLRFQTRWGHQITWLLVRALMRRGCYISILADIGPGLILPHPTGVVIGEGSTIGRSVMIYHNVTLGRRAWDEPGCPTIGDDTVIYTGAVIVGPISLGAGVKVAANAVVTRDVSPNSVVAGAPARAVGKETSGRLRA